ncbi:AzlC family ABC transporter permease [Chachezhania sediminis]|uniref:AzlC family ABC transporter permease n=1 Tax=Chachezhania sediminis TaxID=2599291 RepID=UPI00131B684E|nr:AzlC family ABC transporter permease [Chachezhania sediminis]
MSSSTSFSDFLRGARDSIPFILVVGPFGAVFGVVAAGSGLNLFQIMVYTGSIFAGAAQLTSLGLLQEQAPTIIALLSGLAVNLRMGMYSASLTPYMGDAPLWKRAIAAYLMVDQSYALSLARFERDRDMPMPNRYAYFFGTAAVIAPLWCAATLVGALVGVQIPDSWNLDFIVPIAFLSLVAPMLRTPAHRIAALTAGLVSLPAAFLPYNLGLIVAGALGMIVGARVELSLRRKGSWTDA